MSNQESYIERRQLFKNIWETALDTDMEGKTEEPIRNKVIKTLRLDEVDKFPIGKSKNQKIKNLRTVCNKILDFCDRQDADDNNVYKQFEGAKINKSGARPKRRKRKFIRKKRKSQSNLFKTVNVTIGRAATSQKPGGFKSLTKPMSPNKPTRTILKPNLKRFKLRNTTVKAETPGSKDTAKKITKSNVSSGDSKTARVTRVVRKKRSPRKTKKRSSSGVTGKPALST